MPNINPADTREVLGTCPSPARRRRGPRWPRRAGRLPRLARHARARARPHPLPGARRSWTRRRRSWPASSPARKARRSRSRWARSSAPSTSSSTRRPRAGASAASTVPSELPHNFCYTLRQPLGVVACITPWNFPVAIPVWKIAPALVARQHRRLQAGHAHPGDGERASSRSSSARACPRASSTWCWARAAPSATRSSTTRTCARCQLHRQQRGGGGDLRARGQAHDPRAVRRWAARTRSSCSPTPTSTWPSRPPRRARSARPASAAPPPRA